MRKKTIAILLILALVLLPLVGWMGLAFFIPSVYHNTFLAELPHKYERLSSIEEPKIVVIGGSSVAFGIDSRQMEEQLGRPVVNFGLYASLGSKVMLDLARDAIRPGDIVVLAFEADNQTLSMYFNAESMWQVADCDPALLLRMGRDNYPEMAGGLYEYTKDKLFFLREGAPSFEGVYTASSFDEYGDISYPRPENIMPAGFDGNAPIDFSEIRIEDAFSAYVNEYVADVRDKGAEICYSYCPMNERAIRNGTTEETTAFTTYLSNSFDCPVIGEIDDYLYPAEYFFDTNFHLNDAGVPVHSRQLAEDVAQHFDLELMEAETPAEPTEKPEESTEPLPSETEEATELVTYEEYEHCFTYEAYYDAGWAISGVTEEGKTAIELGIPLYHEGQKVVAILENAFLGCEQLEEIRISCSAEDSITLYDGVFSGLPALKSVVLDAEPTSIKISTEGLLRGAVSEPVFYVEKGQYGKYVTDYYWSIYAEYIKPLRDS